MREISVNSWATKIEYISSRISDISYSPVREWHKTRAGMRLKTSHPFFTLKRCDVSRQDLPSTVVLRGTGINKSSGRFETDIVDNDENKNDIEHIKQSDTGKRLYTSNGRIRSKKDCRPKTSLGFGANVKLNTNNSENNFEDLVEVYSFRAEGKSLKVTRINQDKTLDSKTIKAAIGGTEHDTSPLKEEAKSTKRELFKEQGHYTSDRTETLTPTWKSSETLSGWSDSRQSGRMLERTAQRKPALRPLLNDPHSAQHSKECPYKCRNCFKACLVSDNYIRSVSRNEFTE